jgi:hypothetical protein
MQQTLSSRSGRIGFLSGLFLGLISSMLLGANISYRLLSLKKEGIKQAWQSSVNPQ